MSQVWYQWNRVWIYVALLVPLAVAVTLLMTRLRPSHDLRRSIGEVGMFFGTLPWVWMILTPMKLDPKLRTVYLVPFSDLLAQFSLGVPQYILVQVGGNLMVLFLFGFFARMRFPAIAKPLPLLVFGWLFALTLELLQHAFTGGRVFSVDDVLLNGIGCALGGLVTPLLVSARRG